MQAPTALPVSHAHQAPGAPACSAMHIHTPMRAPAVAVVSQEVDDAIGGCIRRQAQEPALARLCRLWDWGWTLSHLPAEQGSTTASVQGVGWDECEHAPSSKHDSSSEVTSSSKDTLSLFSHLSSLVQESVHLKRFLKGSLAMTTG